MQLLYYLLLLPAAYVLLIAAPAVAMCFVVFSKKNQAAAERTIPSRDYYLPYKAELLAAAAALQALAPQEACVQSADGITLKGSYYDGGFARTAIFLHGYRANPTETFAVIGKALYERGFNLLLADQRAHGRSGGTHSLLGLGEQEDVLAWVSWAQKHTAAKTLLLYGMSMGSAAIAYASDRLPHDFVGTMILDCGFSSPYDHLREDCKKWHMPGALMLPVLALCARLFFRVDVRKKTAESLARTKVPTLFLHGTADRCISPSQGLENWQACASEKLWLPIAGADHTVAFLKSSPTEKETLFQFIENNTRKTRAEQ